MQTKLIFHLSLFTFQLLAGLGCVKPGLSENLVSPHSSQESPAPEAPPGEKPRERDSGIQFGAIELGGPGCNINAGSTAAVDREHINLPDFAQVTEFTELGLIKRSSCNLTIPFAAQDGVGFVITGFEVSHEHLLPEGTKLRLSFEAFIPGIKGPLYEETILGVDVNHQVDAKLITLPEPLLVCGKSGGLLRVNTNQILDRQTEDIPTLSHLRSLKIQYVPVDCNQ